MLKLCDSGHDMICFEVAYSGEKCPLCEQIDETQTLEEVKAELEKEKEALEKELEEKNG